MQGLFSASKFLTIYGRRDAAQRVTEAVGAGALFFPLIGLLFGVVLALLNRLLERYLESEILGVVLVTLLILMTGAMHLEGTQKTFDGLAGRAKPADHQPSGIYGLLAVLIIVVLKIRATEVIGETRTLSLLLTPVFARWSLVIFLYGSAAAGDQAARTVPIGVKGWHLLVTTAATLIFAAYLVGRTALWIGLCLSLFALLSRAYLHRRYGGITGNQIGSLIELSETLSLVLFASL